MSDPFWVPKSLAEWDERPSTKLKNMVEIIKWHLAEDGRAPLRLKVVHNGEPGADLNELEIDPDYVTLVRPPGSAPDKIVIFVAFPSNNGLITGVSFLFSALMLSSFRYIGSRPHQCEIRRGQRQQGGAGTSNRY